jgi:hypothetical protein
MTQRMASTMFDLRSRWAHNRGDGLGKLIDVRSTNDLKPQISIRLIFNPSSASQVVASWM